jgi:hypothetical protein
VPSAAHQPTNCSDCRCHGGRCGCFPRQSNHRVGRRGQEAADPIPASALVGAGSRLGDKGAGGRELREQSRGERLRRPAQAGRAPRQKAPRVRPPVAFFRERSWGAALQGESSLSRRAGGSVRKRSVPQGRRATVFPYEARHGFATGGVRACQVGVNPPRRAVVLVGVDAVEAKRPLT